MTTAHSRSSAPRTSVCQTIVVRPLWNAVHSACTVEPTGAPRRNLVLDSIVVVKNEMQYALVVYTSFRLRDSAVSGYLVIVLGVASLDSLIQALETWG